VVDGRLLALETMRPMRFGSLGSPEELGLLDERMALLDVLPLRDDDDGLVLSESTAALDGIRDSRRLLCLVCSLL